jgi:CHRD domain-containing protein
VTQAHIHFENRTNPGPIVVFLCTNLGNGPVGTQACPAGGGTISGTITPANVGNGAAAQGLAAGEFDELVRAIRAGATYVNVQTTGRPAGEIRAQLEHNEHGGKD